MAKCKALMGSAVKGLIHIVCIKLGLHGDNMPRFDTAWALQTLVPLSPSSIFASKMFLNEHTPCPNKKRCH